MTFNTNADPQPGQPSATLIVKQGPQIGIHFPINSPNVILGREERCDIIIQDAEVSRRHTRISFEENVFVARDLASTNGTFVNGLPITDATMLAPGDSVGIGQSTLIFECSPDYKPQTNMTEDAGTGQYVIPPEVAHSGLKSDNVQRLLLVGCGCVTLFAICAIGLPILLQLLGIIDLTEILQQWGV